mmetsp:Transcript_46362/g.68435  ORF Transcript_46362/g.68435 Transcript_46362/m.68435 type:complete len:90 (+) Transcript_46362:58-327(+)
MHWETLNKEEAMASNHALCSKSYRLCNVRDRVDFVAGVRNTVNFGEQWELVHGVDAYQNFMHLFCCESALQLLAVQQFGFDIVPLPLSI